MGGRLIRKFVIPAKVGIQIKQLAYWLACIPALAGMTSATHAATPSHCLTLYGECKYKAGFTHFDYVNPDAPKGGTLKLSANAPFDSMNPFILKGVAAPGVAGYVYQSLMTPSYDEPQSYYPLIASAITPPSATLLYSK